MNAVTEIKAEGLDLLRVPFEAHHISKLPKETGRQAKERKEAQDKGNWPPKCDVCGGFHHVRATHLDYVGHAALTDRLLDADPCWFWEPLALDERGLPAMDHNGGLWIKLTVCGVTRLGYGAADGKRGGDAVKEIIGDALRNAAMRFGAALDLWHKGELHPDVPEPAGEGQGQGTSQGAVSPPPAKPKNWGGRYPTATALKRAMHEHNAELVRLGNEGSQDDLDTYLTSPEYGDYITQAEEHAKAYLHGGPPAPEEYVSTFALEQRARDMIALRGGRAAEPIEEKETTNA